MARSCRITPILSHRFKLRLPPSNESPEGDSEQLIKTKALEHGVLALPGAAFFANSRKTAYVRCAFSMVSEEEVDEGLRRLSVVVKEEQAKIKS
jgi:tryptophan aminotransferase